MFFFFFFIKDSFGTNQYQTIFSMLQDCPVSIFYFASLNFLTCLTWSLSNIALLKLPAFFFFMKCFHYDCSCYIDFFFYQFSLLFRVPLNFVRKTQGVETFQKKHKK